MSQPAGPVWALMTARGGSKSLPLKNLHPLAGRPLMAHGLIAARRVAAIGRVFVSTDHPGIADLARKLGAEVAVRPPELAGDQVSSLAVILDFLATAREREGGLPAFLVLLEPTSPFVRPAQIEACLGMLAADPLADSAQTVSLPPPNHHAYNQRVLAPDGTASFRFAAERAGLVNKQQKPRLYVHGNLRVMRPESVIRHQDIFGPRSLALAIPRVDALDVDGPEDFAWAEALVKAGLAELN